MSVNVWVAVQATTYAALSALVADPEYAGEHASAVRILGRIVDSGNVVDMFNQPTIEGSQYVLCSLTINGAAGDGLQAIQAALTEISGLYDGQFFLLGAWNWDGRQLGTEWVDAGDHDQGVTGSPVYPVHAALLQFMPPVWDGENLVPATELTDVNLIQGQSPRRFDQ